MTKTDLKKISLLINETNLLIIRIISAAVRTRDTIALNELGIDDELAKKISALNSKQKKLLSESGYLISKIKVNNIAFKLAIQDLKLK